MPRTKSVLKQKSWLVVSLLALLVISFGLNIFFVYQNKKNKYDIKYEVITDNNIYWIEFTDNTGLQINNRSPQSPWTYEFSTENPNLELYLNTREMSCDGPCPDFRSSITGKVYVDGKEKLSKTSEKKVVLKAKLVDLVSKTRVKETVDEAKQGCRSPDELGCAECLVINDDTPGSCSIRYWTGGSGDTNQWYNAVKIAPCYDILTCAACPKRQEEELHELLSNEDFKACDCSKTDTDVVDACYSPSSCACLCGRYERLLTACPFVN